MKSALRALGFFNCETPFWRTLWSSFQVTVLCQLFTFWKFQFHGVSELLLSGACHMTSDCIIGWITLFPDFVPIPLRDPIEWIIFVSRFPLIIGTYACIRMATLLWKTKLCFTPNVRTKQSSFFFSRRKFLWPVKNPSIVILIDIPEIQDIRPRAPSFP